MNDLIEKAIKAKEAAYDLGIKTTEQKNLALQSISKQLVEESQFILEENEKDLNRGKENGLSDSLLDRLTLTEERIKDMAQALMNIVHLDDPIDEVLESWERPNGLQIKKVRVPIGVVGMVYEARPNVTVDASSLCLKTGNPVLLRGSSSAIHSNKAIVQVIHRALQETDISPNVIQLVEDTSRQTASEMFKLNEYLDVLIPRGSANLIKTVVSNATVPVLETGAGNCHIYIDETADPEMAKQIAVNGKTQRPSVCNSTESFLVHEKWAESYFKDFVEALHDHDVELRGDQKSTKYVPSLKQGTEEDWGTEYLDFIASVKIVKDVKEAAEHINQYGTKHSEAIISEIEENVEAFFKRVDAAALYHNASTRFTDGEEFGFGAEIGISTQKLHARGPMGLPALTSSTYIVRGTGQIK
ncbi:glutamate-5-semialdehyde dehydrogenase [Pontibacillus sp. HMF3514]|uniref:glutamate-5-semialdehyde dehydrogenase n=1 Tax=Pontibacillus sp. HMF3514 TaxID=2692425 RepID=UPI00132002FD|nr:glutamate-5-semialdehyde dehydrogenase [Pontibacillus sp. HMF3514]QHE52848.1 glutamate-5-semialdehyde dehydrogenase [Pontibacillus sp. HMF3514]